MNLESQPVKSVEKINENRPKMKFTNIYEDEICQKFGSCYEDDENYVIPDQCKRKIVLKFLKFVFVFSFNKK